jgi:hypothetical protein
MTDPLTDAVRRLKGLQEDVERLKAEQDEEGQPRLLFSEAETAAVSQGLGLRSTTLEDDAVYGDAKYQTTTVGFIERFSDASVETAEVDVSQALRSQSLTSDAFYNSATYQTATIDAVEIARESVDELATAADSLSQRSSGVKGTATYSATTGYNTATYSA